MQRNLTQTNAYIFRIVHVGNMPNVIARGCHCRNEAKGNYTEMGNLDLINKRNDRVVPCGPGGTLSDYVPFYFTPFTPMLLNIKTGFGVTQQPMDEIVILVSSIPRLIKIGRSFVFTDRHAYLKAAKFSTDVKDLDWIIWSALQARNFKKDDADRFEKYQAEALVHKHVSIDDFLAVVCYDDSVLKHLQVEAEKAAAKVKFAVDKRWYV
jgi:hypothetical protein